MTSSDFSICYGFVVVLSDLLFYRVIARVFRDCQEFSVGVFVQTVNFEVGWCC